MRGKNHAHAVIILLIVVGITIGMSGDEHASAQKQEVETEWPLRILIQRMDEDIQSNGYELKLLRKEVNDEFKLLREEVNDIKSIAKDNQTLAKGNQALLKEIKAQAKEKREWWQNWWGAATIAILGATAGVLIPIIFRAISNLFPRINW